MSRDPAATARAAFAMAGRAELVEGQRAAALNRGMLMVKKYGLDPDDFDIPGRTPTRPRIDTSKFADYDHDRPQDGMTGTSWRRDREWTTIDETRAAMGLSPIQSAMREFADRMAAAAAAETIFRKTQIEMQSRIRAEAMAFGRARVRIVSNDGC